MIEFLSQRVPSSHPYLLYFLAEKEKEKGNIENAIKLYEKAAENFKEDRDNAAKMLLKAALISEPRRKDYYFKRAEILAEDENLKSKIEEIWKKEKF